MGRAPTIRDVAVRAGVSVATASNVVNGARPVGEASRRKVVEAIAALDYQLDRAASALAAGPLASSAWSSPTSPTSSSPASSTARDAAERDGYDLLIVSTSEDPANERRRVEALVARRIDGLDRRAGERQLHDRAQGRRDGCACPRGAGRPRRPAPASTPSRRLLRGRLCGSAPSHRLGHRDIVVLALAGARQHPRAHRRLPPRLGEAGLDGRERIVFGGHDLEGLRGRSSSSSTAPIGRPRSSPSPTSARSRRSKPRALDLDIPDDVSIVGFDDFDWMSVLGPISPPWRSPSTTSRPRPGAS